MKESKYVVHADCVAYFSNSRNARKHLLNTGAKCVDVFKNGGDFEKVSIARRTKEGVILYGASRN